MSASEVPHLHVSTAALRPSRSASTFPPQAARPGFEPALRGLKPSAHSTPSSTASLSVSHDGPLSVASVPIGGAGLPLPLSSFVISPVAGFGWPSLAPENAAQMPTPDSGFTSSPFGKPSL